MHQERPAIFLLYHWLYLYILPFHTSDENMFCWPIKLHCSDRKAPKFSCPSLVALFTQCCSTVYFSKDERIEKNYVWSLNYKRVFGQSWSWSTTYIERLPLLGLTLSEIQSSYNILQTSVHKWNCARSITLFCKLMINLRYPTIKPSASYVECKCHCQSPSKSRKTFSSGQAM